MNIQEKIIEIQRTRDKEAFVEYFFRNKDQVEALVIQVKNLHKYPMKEYASWILIHLIKSKRFDLNYIYIDFIDILIKTDNQTVLRNVICCINHLDHTACRESELIDRCIEFISNFENKVALQVYSIYLLIPFAQKYPELAAEIQEIIALHAPGKTPAYRSAQKRFMRSISPQMNCSQ